MQRRRSRLPPTTAITPSLKTPFAETASAMAMVACDADTSPKPQSRRFVSEMASTSSSLLMDAAT